MLTLFDMLLAPPDRDLRARPLSERRQALEDFVASLGKISALSVTPGTADRALAQTWLDDGKIEGVVAKRGDRPYLEGERAMIKVKRTRTADCVVAAFAMRPVASSAARFCSVSTTRRICWIMSASRPAWRLRTSPP